MKLNIKKSDLWTFCIMFTFVEPAYFQTFSQLHMVYNLFRVLAVAYFILEYVQRKKKPGAVVIYLAMAIFTMLIACKFTLGNYESTLAAYLPFLGLTMWVDINASRDIEKVFRLLCGLLDVYVLIDIITLVLFPDGLYISQSYQAAPYICWFLGYKNPQIRILLPYLTLTLVYDYMRFDKLPKLTFVRLIAVVYTTIRLGSTTGLIAVVLFLALTAIFKNTGRDKVKNIILKMLNIRNAYIIIAVIAVLVIFFDFQYNFSYLIVNILHKELDLTDRIYVWKKVIPYIQKHLWVGSGVIYAEYSRAEIGASHAHNYFLNTLYNGGIISMVFLTFSWFSASKKSQKHTSHHEVRMLIFMSIVFLTMGISESLTGTMLLYPVLMLAYHSKYIVLYKEANYRL